MRLLVVDLLAEREGFGKWGVRETARHFSPTEVFLWSPHTGQRLDYGFGTVVSQLVEADAIVITGSRRNVSMWGGVDGRCGGGHSFSNGAFVRYLLWPSESSPTHMEDAWNERDEVRISWLRSRTTKAMCVCILCSSGARC